MKSLFFALSFIFAGAGQAQISGGSDPASREKFIQALIAPYQAEAVRRLGQPIALKMHWDSNIQQALGGHDSSGHLVIEVYAGIAQLPLPMMSYVLCHELGHILGEVPMAAIPPNQRLHVDLRDSVEGEADYFSGRCLRQLAPPNQAPELTVLQTAKVGLETINHESLPWPLPSLPPYPGINPSYPKPECRLLSVLAGAKGNPRPLCWYNPQLLR